MNTPPTPPSGATHQPVWRTADEIATLFGVQPRTVKMWAYRRHITTGPDGRYDENQVRDWHTNRRDKDMDQLRRGGVQRCGSNRHSQPVTPPDHW